MLCHIRFVLFVFLFVPISAGAQTALPFFKTLKHENGLSHNKVNCILEDQRGFLWFGTEDGLDRYDGRYFTVFKSEPYNKKPGIAGNTINDLYEDKDGIIWIATEDAGLISYNYRLPAAQQFKQYVCKAPNGGNSASDGVNKIAEDHQGNLWLATTGSNPIRFNKKTGRFDAPVQQHTSCCILSLLMDSGDTLLVGRAEGGLLRINTRTLQSREDQRYQGAYAGLPHTAIPALFKDSKRSYWFSSWSNNLYNLPAGDAKEKTYASDEIAAFAEDKKGRIWMAGRNHGVTVYDRDKDTFYHYAHSMTADGSLVNDHVNAVYIDSRGIVWIGTNLGISYLNPLFAPFEQHIFPKTGEDVNVYVYDFYKDEQRTLWIGTSDGIFLQRPDGGAFEHRKITYKGQQLAVTKFYKDVDGSFYIGTDYSLFRYDARTNTVTLLPNTENDPLMGHLTGSRIVSIVRDTIASHPVLLVLPYGRYFAYYDLVDKKWVSRVDTSRNIVQHFNIRDNMIRKFYRDTRGALWLATNKSGLGEWQPQDLKPIQYHTYDTGNNASISNNDVYDIQQDGSGNFWISTYGGGLNYYQPAARSFMHITESSNLTEGLQSDKRGNIWMICNGHLHKYDTATKTYSCYDLPSLQTNGGIMGYIYKDDDQTLYAGGENFYLTFSPDKIAGIWNEPKIYFTDFRIFDKSNNQLLEKKEITLNHFQNYFSIEYAAPEYSGDNLNYAYMLEGYDKGWVAAGKQNVASYSNLEPGKYRFKVRASNWRGSKVEHFESLAIVILPPFWSTIWFYLIVFLFVFSLGYLFYQYRIKEMLKRQAMRNRIAQDLHDHVGATLSSISIYSEVAKIYHEEDKSDDLKKVLLAIGESSTGMIQEMADIVWAINPRNDNFTSIVERIKAYAQPLCEAKRICFSLEADQKLSQTTLAMVVRKNFYLILKETINNAIKHANCRNLEVAIRLSQHNTLEMEVKDDGDGFDPAAAPERRLESLSGNGLVNLKHRAAELNARLEINSAPGKGTAVRLIFNI